MLRVKHPWMKGQNLVVGSTVFSFGKDGIAQVKDMHPAREDLAALLRRHPRITMVEDQSAQAPVPVVAAPSPVPVAAVPPSVEKVAAPEEPKAPEEPVAAAPLPEEPVRKPVAKQKRRIDKE